MINPVLIAEGFPLDLELIAGADHVFPLELVFIDSGLPADFSGCSGWLQARHPDADGAVVFELTGGDFTFSATLPNVQWRVSAAKSLLAGRRTLVYDLWVSWPDGQERRLCYGKTRPTARVTRNG
ncbi:MAG: hypothetical protein EPN21_13195 [Methylococcaceae bacterium]|nr:MAG: hypothetical protein EPN21_13195 [Methylococcaceae bacterium]